MLFDKLKIKENKIENKAKEEKSGNYDCNISSSFTFSHLPLDMSLTIGNFLRRILISTTKGVGIMAVEISDRNGKVNNKFTSLAGILETTPYLIFNLKEIVFQKKTNKEGIFCLELDIENKKNQEMRVSTANFSKNEEIEIKNEVELATLSAASDGEEKNPRLAIKLYCQEDFSYHLPEGNEQKEEMKKMIKEYVPDADEENIILLDTDYQPIKNVSFEKKEIVISSNSKTEELIINITTDGSISPKEALKKAFLTMSQTNDIVQKF
jgi:DNA-directed RNA polymerase subunit alpha